MNIIIDTHIFIWALADPGRLSLQKRAALETLANTIYVSSVTIAEIMIKSFLGKLEVTYNPVDMAEESGFELLDFKGRDALLLQRMPFLHRDPFDRMLIAQALANEYPLMTEDEKINLYDCRIWRDEDG